MDRITRAATKSVLIATVVLTQCRVGCGTNGESGAETASDSYVLECEEPSEILLVTGEASGYVRCEDGSVNRVEAVVLDPMQYVERIHECSDDVATDDSDCRSDLDCDLQEWGQCEYADAYYRYGCFCVYMCASDADCREDQLCLSAEAANGITWPRCVSAECRDGDDCSSGECGVSTKGSQCGPWAKVACRTGLDECRSNEQCGDGQDDLCTPHDDRWQCRHWYGCD